ncbi:adenosylhomocysteine nucleosidase [Mycoplasma testudineum]|uniref:Adenosylhomocysteine nucleosidase n=1 Tax=Mycoplasma testudineum TaxID=244584 RepID=A0A4R6IE53_9MOLU|nr:hypothetical protein [Mycoplasma testudineum]OYD27002.1 hypothetical protein CG473_01555 [Mycoplasma testudineum]TDO20550.1 adenosylhomocysteine nucleosidase [Mycoplasma testudineum]
MAKKTLHIIVADRMEIEIISQSGFAKVKVEDSKIRKYYFLEKGDVTLILVWSKIGLTNAAMTAQDMISRYNPKIIYNYGAVGSIRKEDLGKIFIISEASYGDVETPWYPLGQIPGESRNYPLFHNFRRSLPKARIASLNSFVSEFERAMYISQILTTTLFDMETAAIAQVALANKTAFTSVKAVSDVIDLNKKVSNEQINANIKQAAELAFPALLKIAI